MHSSIIIIGIESSHHSQTTASSCSISSFHRRQCLRFFFFLSFFFFFFQTRIYIGLRTVLREAHPCLLAAEVTESSGSESTFSSSSSSSPPCTPQPTAASKPPSRSRSLKEGGGLFFWGRKGRQSTPSLCSSRQPLHSSRGLQAAMASPSNGAGRYPLDTAVEIVVRSPTTGMEDIAVTATLQWTVEELKAHMSEVHPAKPALNEQKLVYSGRLLLDHMKVRPANPNRCIRIRCASRSYPAMHCQLSCTLLFVALSHSLLYFARFYFFISYFFLLFFSTLHPPSLSHPFLLVG